MSRLAVFLPAVVVAAAGCGSAEPAPGALIPAIIHTSVLDEHSGALPGVEICVDGRRDIPCATTDATGGADLAVPANSELVLLFKKDGFVPTLREYRTGAASAFADVGAWFMQRTDWYKDAAARIGGRLDLEAAGILVVQTAASDVHFTIAPRRNAIVGPFFFKRIGGGDLDWCMDGECLPMAAWGNVPPGGYGLVASGYGVTCRPIAFACPDGSAGCAGIEARAGHVSWAQIACTENDAAGLAR